ncbi:MAG TPA: DUF3043 domain-containing protein [Candidatus Corynebacterium avicola]|uniref:DUF3043 domain-containing protein n=1 Tax=Candidatus Corynebacterium avicola TaxID=2838527 RepID=A0A9D1UMI4_9CORY|nr:DUF3043 domain-containing protein [Candidatus Corynebacterium avicola]
MKLPWKNSSDSDDTDATAASAQSATAADTSGAADGSVLPKGQTPKKGRPTPKRNEVERATGVRRSHYDAPLTPKEARQRKKDIKSSMSKEEYKEQKRKQREEAAAARQKANERMMAGDPDYLLARDQGKEKALVRNLVDSKRYLMNYFLPIALIVVVVMIVGTQYPDIANMVSLLMLVVILVMVVEGFFLGRRANRLVNERYPDNTFGKWSIGFYAFTRATMIRKMRTPAPQTQLGDTV